MFLHVIDDVRSVEEFRERYMRMLGASYFLAA